MRLWATLYLMVWVVALEFLLALVPALPEAESYAHVGLGAVIVALAYANYAQLRRTKAPGRLKRTSRATFGLAVTTAVIGLPLFFGVGKSWVVLGVSLFHALLFLHIFLALAILAQTAVVASAFDMWEEGEFLQPSPPGEIPAPSTARAGAEARRD